MPKKKLSRISNIIIITNWIIVIACIFVPQIPDVNIHTDFPLLEKIIEIYCVCSIIPAIVSIVFKPSKVIWWMNIAYIILYFLVFIFVYNLMHYG